MADAGIIIQFPSTTSTTSHGSVSGPIGKSSRNGAAFATKARTASSGTAVPLTASSAVNANGNGDTNKPNNDPGNSTIATGGVAFKQSRYTNMKTTRSPPTDGTPPFRNPADAAPTATSPSIKKRRKVNHACVYCRRSHMTCDSGRPCSRCIKRNIGHLCHDEPRESTRRPSRPQVPSQPPVIQQQQQQQQQRNNSIVSVTTPNSFQDVSMTDDQTSSSNTFTSPPQQAEPDTSLCMNGDSVLPMSCSGPGLPGVSAAASTDVNPQFLLNNWQMDSIQPHMQDMHSLHPSYTFNVPEVSNEFHLLSNFLSSSIIDENTMYGEGAMERNGMQPSPQVWGSSQNNGMVDPLAPNYGLNSILLQQQQQQLYHQQVQQEQQSQQLQQPQQRSQPGLTPMLSPIPQPSALAPGAQSSNNNVGEPSSAAMAETYYHVAADPSGTESADERMNKLLKAKYDAGLLKPFNYVSGYSRMYRYMERNLHPESRVKILKQLDKFRPKFRERMQTLTDLELVLVEMWFDRTLMEYDRVFASMAVPACCWRRTGQIFRGNKEMAQLIGVSIESLRDGKLAIHEIMTEDQLVNYWEKFSAIAFDGCQKAMLTTCTLKNPNSTDPESGVDCCFSFTVRRDNHNIPSLIIGNFLPKKRMDR